MSTPEGGRSENAQGGAFFDAIEKLVAALFGFLLWVIFPILKHGVKRLPFKSSICYVYVASIAWLFHALAVSQRHFPLLIWLLDQMFPISWTDLITRRLAKVSVEGQFLGLCAVGGTLFLFTLGIKPYLVMKKFQRKLDQMGLKNGAGAAPKLIAAHAEGQHRQKLLIKSEGIGLDRFETKKSDLESAFGAVIEGIRTGRSPGEVQIVLAKNRIPEVSRFQDLLPEIQKSYSFLIGESLGGLHSQCIRDLPHLLIAGTTGGGKSVFFNQTVLGLMHTSPGIQFYLLDLKGGVEVKQFAALPNVTIAKTTREAVQLLKAVKSEMEWRFQYMEEKGYKRIEPGRDKMDLIVVGVDEASVLYTKPSARSPDADFIAEARDLTDSLAKLARAAAIHLILATQKVTKETIDTKIQENIGGRMCFRMNTLQGSLTVLGNKMAFELPDHKGRAIWSAGNQFVEVQAPLITEQETEREIEVLKFDYEQGKRKNYQDMLILNGDNQNKSRPLNKAARKVV